MSPFDSIRRFISWLAKGTSLTHKMLLATLIIGLTVSAVLDSLNSIKLGNILESQLKLRLEHEAQRDRQLFDTHIRLYSKAIKLFASQKKLTVYLDDLEKNRWNDMDSFDIKMYEETPRWYPSTSVTRTFARTHYAILLDRRGRVREIFKRGPSIPEGILEPAKLLSLLSHNDLMLTNIDGNPFLVTAEAVRNDDETVRATLLILSPLDSDFLVASQNMIHKTHVVALINKDTSTVISSSNPYQIPPGTKMDTITNNYLITGKSFFDYGVSDLLLQFSSLISKSETAAISKKILSENRRHNAITAAMLILTFSILISYITKRIDSLTKKIVSFSQNTLGIEAVATGKGDQVQIMDTQFELLKNGIVEANAKLHKEMDERIAAEKVAKDNEERYRLLFNSGDDSVFVVNLTPDSGMPIFEEVNKIASIRLGYTREELLQMGPQDINDPTVMQDVRKALADAMTSDGHVIFETVHMTKSGKRIPMEISTHIFTMREHKMALSIARDISARKMDEQRIQAYADELKEKNKELLSALDAAKSADKAKGQFLANISHELRTPLNGIIGLTELVLDSQLNREQKDYLSMVMSSADSLLVIINDILDFSRISAHKLQINNEVFRLRELFGSTVNFLAFKAHEKDLALLFNIEPNVPDTIIGDKTRLRQVMSNLIINAIKFTERGSVNIRIDLDALHEKYAQLHFYVTDTGIGVPPEYQQHIFDSFVQADGSASRKHGGIGLGLAISSELVKLMGGKLELTSNQDNGSTFHFSLSFKIAKTELPAPPMVESNNSKNDRHLNILLAEDNPINQKLTTRLLEKAGHKVSVSSNGLEAIEQATTEKYDIILMDIMMPVLNGYDATRTIRAKEKERGERTPIIALTAKAMNGDREKSLAAGMDDYITKPIKSEDLHNIINEHIN